MARKRRIRPVVFVLSILALGFGALGWSLYVQFRQEYVDRTLIQAIQSQRTDEALAWLSRGADANARSSAKRQPLSLLDWLKILVDRKLRPKYDGPSALALAVWNDETPVVQGAALKRSARRQRPGNRPAPPRRGSAA